VDLLVHQSFFTIFHLLLYVTQKISPCFLHINWLGVRSFFFFFFRGLGCHVNSCIVAHFEPQLQG